MTYLKTIRDLGSSFRRIPENRLRYVGTLGRIRDVFLRIEAVKGLGRPCYGEDLRPNEEVRPAEEPVYVLGEISPLSIAPLVRYESVVREQNALLRESRDTILKEINLINSVIRGRPRFALYNYTDEVFGVGSLGVLKLFGVSVLALSVVQTFRFLIYVMIELLFHRFNQRFWGLIYSGFSNWILKPRYNFNTASMIRLRNWLTSAKVLGIFVFLVVVTAELFVGYSHSIVYQIGEEILYGDQKMQQLWLWPQVLVSFYCSSAIVLIASLLLHKYTVEKPRSVPISSSGKEEMELKNYQNLLIRYSDLISKNITRNDNCIELLETLKFDQTIRGVNGHVYPGSDVKGYEKETLRMLNRINFLNQLNNMPITRDRTLHDLACLENKAELDTNLDRNVSMRHVRLETFRNDWNAYFDYLSEQQIYTTDNLLNNSNHFRGNMRNTLLMFAGHKTIGRKTAIACKLAIAVLFSVVVFTALLPGMGLVAISLVMMGFDWLGMYLGVNVQDTYLYEFVFNTTSLQSRELRKRSMQYSEQRPWAASFYNLMSDGKLSWKGFNWDLLDWEKVKPEMGEWMYIYRLPNAERNKRLWEARIREYNEYFSDDNQKIPWLQKKIAQRQSLRDFWLRNTNGFQPPGVRHEDDVDSTVEVQKYVALPESDSELRRAPGLLAYTVAIELDNGELKDFVSRANGDEWARAAEEYIAQMKEEEQLVVEDDEDEDEDDEEEEAEEHQDSEQTEDSSRAAVQNNDDQGQDNDLGE